MKFIKKHKKKFIIGAIALFVLLLAYIIWTMLPNSSKSLYGDRLDGIEDVEITDKNLADVESALEEVDGIKEASSDIKGRLINFSVEVEDGVATSIADTLGPIVIDNFSSEELEYYDLQIFVNGESEEYSVIGYKHKTSDSFVWSNNK